MKKEVINGFEIKFGDVVSVIDMDAIAVGSEKDCKKIRLENRDFLAVSKKFRINTPGTAFPYMDEYVIAPIPFAFHKSGSVICFRACENNECEDLVIDMGITFEGDEKFEFGHYFLWNQESGELSLSEEMDWIEVTKFDLKRWENNLMTNREAE